MASISSILDRNPNVENIDSAKVAEIANARGTPAPGDISTPLNPIFESLTDPERDSPGFNSIAPPAQPWLTLDDATAVSTELAKGPDIVLPKLHEVSDSLNDLRIKTMAFAIQFGWKAQVAASHNDATGCRALALRCSKFTSVVGGDAGCKWALRGKETSKDGPVKIYLLNYQHTHPVSATRVQIVADANIPSAQITPLATLPASIEIATESPATSVPVEERETSASASQSVEPSGIPAMIPVAVASGSRVSSPTLAAEAKKRKETNIPVFPSQSDIVDLANELLRLCPKQLAQTTNLEFSSPVDMRIYITAVAIESGFACAIQNRSANAFSLQCSRGENSGTRYKIGCTYAFSSQFDIKKQKWIVSSSHLPHDHPLFEWEYQNGKSRRVARPKGRYVSKLSGSFSRAGDSAIVAPPAITPVVEEEEESEESDEYNPKKRKVDKIDKAEKLKAAALKALPKMKEKNKSQMDQDSDSDRDSESDSESEVEVVRPTKRTKRTSMLLDADGNPYTPVALPPIGPIYSMGKLVQE